MSTTHSRSVPKSKSKSHDAPRHSSKGSVEQKDRHASLGSGARMGGLQNGEGARTIGGKLTVSSMLELQSQVGNQAVLQLSGHDGNAPTVARQPASSAAPDLKSASEPVDLGGLHIVDYADAAMALRYWCATLDDESKALAEGKVAVPPSLAETRSRGLGHAQILEGGEKEPLDRGNATDIRRWYGDYVQALNAGRAAQANEAAARASAAASELRQLKTNLDSVVPQLREMQRAKFKAGDESGLLKTADAIYNVFNSMMVVQDAIDKSLDLAADLRFLGGTASSMKTAVDVSSKIRLTMSVLDKINKAWAVFQLARTAIDLATGGKSESEEGRKGVAAMASIAGGATTLLNASAPLTLYVNLYIGPATSRCLELIAKIEDMISKSTNRSWIELGRFDYVNWSLESGGRPVFDYMLQVMHAGSAADVPEPKGKVDEYFVNQADDFSAGVGSNDEELPTEGWWRWKETDKSKIKRWVFRNRAHLWGMLYGSTQVPSGTPAL